jgi:hypothetical protein
MFHSVADHLDPLPWKSIVCSVKRFDAFLSTLKSAGYRSVPLSDCIGFLKNHMPLPPKSIVITFDDGFLDNWVNAYPLLKKYGFNATVFMATDFIDPRDTVRKTLGDYWKGRAGLGELDWYGYLSMNEMREMIRSGVFEVGSHTKTHTWYFSSAEIVDYHRPGDPYVWLEWNRDPAGKPFWMKRGRDDAWGAPVYAYTPALTARICRENEGVREDLVAFVQQRGGESFFRERDWRKRLSDRATSLGADNLPSSCETGEEYLARVKDEVVTSRRILEEGLGRKVNLLAWPNDAYTEDLCELAFQEARYELLCVVEQCVKHPCDYYCLQRTYVGEKFRSFLLDSIWFRMKVVKAGDGRMSAFLRGAAGVRKTARAFWRGDNETAQYPGGRRGR